MGKNNIEKRVPKGEIRFKLQLTEPQKLAKEQILNHKISLLTGVAGTAKTFLAVNTALSETFKRKYERITILRPTVASEDIGFIPGDVFDKMSHWMTPIVENMNLLYGKDKIEKLLQEGSIRLLPLQYTQGVTFTREFVIIDESQNCTSEQIKMILTRLGKGSSMVFTGDKDQVQLKSNSVSGFNKLINICDKIEEMCEIELTENHRDPIVEKIINCYNKE